jgi:hypothetical protein
MVNLMSFKRASQNIKKDKNRKKQVAIWIKYDDQTRISLMR